MLMTEYETTMVMRPDLGGEAIEGTLDRVREVVKTQGGKLIAIDHWGKKKLAFEIKKQVRGIYVHAHYLGQKGLVAELERNLRISDNILRYETIRMSKDVDATARDEKAYVKPQYEADEPAEREEVVLGGVDLPVADELDDEGIDADADVDVPSV
jgi:small subunit ribosomal protein S6